MAANKQVSINARGRDHDGLALLHLWILMRQQLYETYRIIANKTLSCRNSFIAMPGVRSRSIATMCT